MLMMAKNIYLMLLTKKGQRRFLSSMKTSPVGPKPIFSLLKKALINDINNRDIFMKGIDCSYYYEED